MLVLGIELEWFWSVIRSMVLEQEGQEGVREGRGKRESGVDVGFEKKRELIRC